MNRQLQRRGFRVSVLLVILLATQTIVAQETSTEQGEQPLQALELIHATLSYKLAAVELQLAEQFNREIEDSLSGVIDGQTRYQTLKMKLIPSTVLERLKSNIAIAQTKLELAETGSTARPKEVQLRHAQEKARLAQIRLDSAKESKTTKSSVTRELQIKRLKIVSDIAKLRLKMPERPEYLLEQVDILQWQIDKLSDQFMLLEMRISAIEDRLETSKD